MSVHRTIYFLLLHHMVLRPTQNASSFLCISRFHFHCSWAYVWPSTIPLRMVSPPTLHFQRFCNVKFKIFHDRSQEPSAHCCATLLIHTGFAVNCVIIGYGSSQKWQTMDPDIIFFNQLMKHCTCTHPLSLSDTGQRQKAEFVNIPVG